MIRDQDVARAIKTFVGRSSYGAERRTEHKTKNVFFAEKPLKRSQQILISVAGPFSQLAFGLGGLALVHSLYSDSVVSIDPVNHIVYATSRSAFLGGDLWRGLGWAGVVISLLNLLPLWPLDGGHVVMQVVRRFRSERQALRFMAIFSLCVVGIIAVVGALTDHATIGQDAQFRAQSTSLFDPSLTRAIWSQFQAFPYFVLTSSLLLLIFSGFSCIQTLQSLRQREVAVPAGTFDLQRLRPADPAAVVAELTAWNTGTPPLMPPGWEVSPWLKAHFALDVGVETRVREALADIAMPGPWTLPDPTRPELAALIPYIPRPLDVRDKQHAFSLARVLGNFGDPSAFLELCTGLYQQFGDPEIFYIAATHLARRGFDDDAVSWLRRAMVEIPNPDRAGADMAFTTLRLRTDFQQLISSLRSPV